MGVLVAGLDEPRQTNADGTAQRPPLAALLRAGVG